MIPMKMPLSSTTGTKLCMPATVTRLSMVALMGTGLYCQYLGMLSM